MPNPYILLIIVEVTAIFIALILYLVEYRRHKTLHEQNDLPLLEKLREENDKLIQDAVRESQSIIASAQEQGLGFTKESREKAQVSQEAFLQELEGLKKKVIDDFQAYLKNLETQSSESQKIIEGAAKEKINVFIEKFEQSLSDFMLQTQQQSVSAIDLEIRSARNLIDTYREQQLAVINESILAILERTLALVLTKRLTLKDHMDLVYESLEKAKAEKFIT